MLYIMRHGKTDWNEIHKLQGRTDVELNDEGRAMAAQAAKECAEMHFDICFCSPLVRAKETASILFAGTDVPIVYDDRLKEMSFGIYEGVQNTFSIENCPINVLFQHPEDYKGVPGGESLEELYARTGEFLREVINPLLEEGKNILIVGHGAMNSCIYNQVKNVPIEDFWKAGIVNCKLMKIE